MLLPDAHFANRKLDVHVENRTIYQLPNAEMNVYETHQQADMVELRFGAPVLAGMITGKKVMHLRENSFDFFPGESVILPAGELMQIDFPEAGIDTPTQCLALAIEPDFISTIVQNLNDRNPRTNAHQEWRFADYNFHFNNDEAVNQVISRLIWLSVENNPAKHIFTELALSELIIRLMQTEARYLLTEHTKLYVHQSRLAHTIQYIREHLADPLSIHQLSQKACMSQTNFFRSFKNELGISPVDFINNERITAAKNLLKQAHVGIYDIAASCGFNNVSYFNKMFKRHTGITPTEFRKKHAPVSDIFDL
jgi:AraC family transcriptional regulator